MHQLVMLIAYVRPTRRAAVGQALRESGAPGWTESDVLGHGHAADGRGVEHVRFELVVPSERAVVCAGAIMGAARTGQDGDGIVVSLPALSVERISDLSSGRAALLGE